jgi:hypothetical protein
MPQIKITLTEEEIKKLKEHAELHLNSMSKEARVIIHEHLFDTDRYSVAGTRRTIS